jgi:hypothetical protein
MQMGIVPRCSLGDAASGQFRRSAARIVQVRVGERDSGDGLGRDGRSVEKVDRRWTVMEVRHGSWVLGESCAMVFAVSRLDRDRKRLALVK